ncbi:hypothetical protein Ddye_025467 [Dipteronia dyeriana]|uniref:Peptidase A1 domain-containing protein n=1 Tax=Dipteronia dyeriana TaxID=168575 RepID=A0AAD9TKA0_9ROSI|nr:hypothetical protein Ddye_025467 [Dipteronia dyeriana]
MVIDVGGQFSWLDCDQYYNISSTYRPVPCWSAKCDATTDGFTCVDCSDLGVHLELYITGGVGEDTIRISSTDGRFSLLDVDICRFYFACGLIGFSSVLGKGSASQRILGLGRASNTSLATQLSSAFKLVHNKFALCLPSSKQFYFGSIFVGGGPYYFLPYYPDDASKLLIKTPLVINPRTDYDRPPLSRKDVSSHDYFIDVKGIKIDGKQVSFDTSLLSVDGDGFGGTMISTVNYYTVLHSVIYKALEIDEFSSLTIIFSEMFVFENNVLDFGVHVSHEGVNGRSRCSHTQELPEENTFPISCNIPIWEKSNIDTVRIAVGHPRHTPHSLLSTTVQNKAVGALASTAVHAA